MEKRWARASCCRLARLFGYCLFVGTLVVTASLLAAADNPAKGSSGDEHRLEAGFHRSVDRRRVENGEG